MSNDPHEATAQQQLDAEELQRDYIALRKTKGAFRQLPPPWDITGTWLDVVRNASKKGVTGGSSILACLINANDGKPPLLHDIHRLIALPSFKAVAVTHSLMPGEADDMRELGLDPNNSEDVNKFRIRDWLRDAMRSLSAVSGTTDVNSNLFVHNLIYDITGTAPFLRYLLGWKRPEVDREVGEAARQFFKEKRHLARACVALGWPKEIIAPDFEI